MAAPRRKDPRAGARPLADLVRRVLAPELRRRPAVAWVMCAAAARALERRGLVAASLFEHPAPRDPRDVLAAALDACARAPGLDALVDVARGPAPHAAPSREAARALLERLRADEPTAPSPSDDPDARALGDLYEHLSADDRAQTGLVQTPDFVAEYLLDRTLEPAVVDVGAAQVLALDPACGTGHLLLAAFRRLAGHLRRARPDAAPRALAAEALVRVHGCDLDPDAVAVARLRLAMAWAARAGVAHLDAIPALPALEANLVVADALAPDGDVARRVLTRRYHVVVGNPPYVACRDEAQRAACRARYPDSARGRFTLAAPFTERFFQLALDPREDGGERAGYVGLLTASSFAKRDFGRGLVERVLPRVDLTDVVDTSGAYLPGHGTPTVILLGRARAPTTPCVRAVLGRRGEPARPDAPAGGRVWSSLARHDREPGYEDAFVSVVELPRSALAKHPWSLGGGAAGDLLARLEAQGVTTLGARASRVGVGTITGDDEAFVCPRASARVRGLDDPRVARPLVTGEGVRDWSVTTDVVALGAGDPAEMARLVAETPLGQALWPYRARLESRATFGAGTYREAGRGWFEWHQHTGGARALTITFAFVATHAHFALARGAMVFNRTAPVVELPRGATEDEHLALLAWLDASPAGFWFRSTLASRGHAVDRRRARTTARPWEDYMEFAAGLVARLPLPPDAPDCTALARALDAHARAMADASPRAVLSRYDALRDGPAAPLLDAARARRDDLLARMVSLQEELDWRWYERLGLLPDPLRAPHAAAREAAHADPRAPHPTAPGHRAFERALWRRGDPAWLDRNGYARPTDEALSSYPSAWRELLALRVAIAEASPAVGLLERPEHKRRWALPDHDAEARDAAAALLLDRVEAAMGAFARPVDARALASRLRDDATAAALAGVCHPRDADALAALSARMESRSVPYLAAMRHTAAGLAKRARWEEAWALQRREDAGEAVGPVPAPPKYTRGDWRDASGWSLRGPLDVPRERFVAYPRAAPDGVSTLYAPASWALPARARALADLYLTRRDVEGWGREALRPLLAGLLELLPSLHHGRDAWAELVAREQEALGWRDDELRAWRPTWAARRRL